MRRSQKIEWPFGESGPHVIPFEPRSKSDLAKRWQWHDRKTLCTDLVDVTQIFSVRVAERASSHYGARISRSRIYVHLWLHSYSRFKLSLLPLFLTISEYIDKHEIFILRTCVSARNLYILGPSDMSWGWNPSYSSFTILFASGAIVCVICIGIYSRAFVPNVPGTQYTTYISYFLCVYFKGNDQVLSDREDHRTWNDYLKWGERDPAGISSFQKHRRLCEVLWVYAHLCRALPFLPDLAYGLRNPA